MSFWTGMKTELMVMYKKASFWVAAIGAGFVAGWQAMPDAMHQSILTAFPWIGTIGPIIWLISFVIARAAPQTTTPTTSN